jgi:hypothetical protein
MKDREEKERKKKRRKKIKSLWGRRVFSLGLDPPCWLCSRSQLLGTIKG